MIQVEIKPESQKYNIDDLFEIVRMLRSPEGCPWDRVQTHETLKKPMIEEAYEAVDAINLNNRDKMIEEFGDVLLQVVFHSVLGEENNNFSLDDITDRCCRKLIYRHSHVFGDITANDEYQALANWDEMKLKEKGLSSVKEDLEDIPDNFTALMRASKMAKKLRKAGVMQKKDILPEVNFDSEESVGKFLYEFCANAEESGIDAESALCGEIQRRMKEL